MTMRYLPLFFALFVISGEAHAQIPSRSVRLEGFVQDSSGAAIADAQVILRTDRGTEWGKISTTASGIFHFVSVDPGEYTIEVQKEGFKTSKTSVIVGSKALTSLKMTLSIGELHEEITVQSDFDPWDLSLDPSDNRGGVVMDSNMLEQLPVLDQNYLGAVQNFLDEAATATGGVSLTVDGMEEKDAGVSPSAIQEVRINQDPYSSEFSRPGKGRIEVITKQESRKYHGAFTFAYRNSIFNGANPFALTRPSEERRNYDGYISGPLWKSKKTFFMASVNHLDDDLQSIVFAQDLSGPIRENVPSPNRTTQFAVRLTHHFNERHTSSFQYKYKNYSADNQGVGGFVLPDAGYNTSYREDDVSFSDSHTFSPKLVNQLQIMYERDHEPTLSTSHTQALTVTDAFVSGGAQADQLFTQNSLKINDVLSWNRGKHLLKFGVNVPNWTRIGLDDYKDFGGEYTFSSLADYANGLPLSFVLQRGQTHYVFNYRELAGFVQDQIRVQPKLSIAFGLRYDWQNYFHSNYGFAPRASFAYAFGNNHKAVLRGGAGVFNDRTGFGPIEDIVRYSGPTTFNYLITNPNYPNPFTNISPADLPPSLVRLAPDIRLPYFVQYNVAIERKILKQATLVAAYEGAQGFDLFRSLDLNAPPPPLYTTPPFPQYAVYRQIQSVGRQSRNAFEITFRGNVSRHFSAMAQYILSRTYNDTGGIGYFPANNYDLSGEWARADFDRTHRFNMLAAANAGKYFSLGATLYISSGTPYTITTGLDPYNDGLANARPPGVSRNSAQNPGSARLDLRWSHRFQLTKPTKREQGATMNLAIDAFNALNHVNYGGYVGVMTSPFFGEQVSALPMRRLQLSIGFKF
jgi:hypothetical protein